LATLKVFNIQIQYSYQVEWIDMASVKCQRCGHKKKLGYNGVKCPVCKASMYLIK